MPAFNSSNDGGDGPYEGGDRSCSRHPEQAALTLGALVSFFFEP